MGRAVSTPSIEALSRRLLHIDVADKLRELIIWGELEPGQRLNERMFCERFGISRTPLREAFMILSAEGLLTLLPNRGAMVTPLTSEQVEDMFEVMGALEGLAGELACRLATDEEIDEITRLHGEMRRHYEHGELREYFAANQRIHRRIIECARNEELANVTRRMSARIRWARYKANFSAERWRQAVSEHEEILDALVRRDGKRLKTLLQQHLHNKYEVIAEWLQASAAAQ